MKRTIGIGLFLLACLQGCATYVEMTLSSRAHSGITYTGVEEAVKEAGGQIRQFCMPYLEGCTGYIYAPDNLELESYEFDFSVVASNDTLTYDRSEEHTSELQSRPHLVCRLLLEKKNNK